MSKAALAFILALVLAGCPPTEPQEPANLGPRLEAKWETIQYTKGSTWIVVTRTKVPGGWLVSRLAGDSLEYMPDPKHEWLTPKAEK